MYRVGDKERRVVSHLPSQVLRESFLRVGNSLLDRLQCRNRVRTRRLIDGDGGCWTAIEAGIAIEIRSAEFYSGDVTQTQDRSIRVGADDNVFEVLNRVEAPFGLNIKLKLLVVGDRAGTDPTQ